MPVPSGDLFIEKTGIFTFTTTGNKLVFSVIRPILVYRIFVIASVDNTGTNMVWAGDHELVGGGATSPEGNSITGNMTGADEVANNGYYKEAGDFVTGMPILVLPGEQFAMRVVTAATAGSGICGFEYEVLPFVAANRWRTMKDGSTEIVSLLNAVTKVAS